MGKQIILIILALVMVGASSVYAPGWKLDNGTATYYGERFHGRKTASGEVFDMNKITAAHPRIPLGFVVRVTNKANGKSVDVRINDRGPYTCEPKDHISLPGGGRDCRKWIPRSDRFIDLSKASFDAICETCDWPMKVSLESVQKNAGQ